MRRWRWATLLAALTLLGAGFLLSSLLSDSRETAACCRTTTAARTVILTEPGTTTSPGAAVLFEDTFDGAAGSLPNPRDWTAVTRCDTNPTTNECQHPSAVHLDGAGHLVLDVQNHKCPKVTSAQAYCIGRVQTMANGALAKNLPVKYVLHDFAAPFRMEWSMKMPTIPGSGGVAWSLSTWTTDAESAGKRDEIDAQEGPAARPDLLRCNSHFGASQHVVLVATGQDLSARFHTYWMQVYARRIVTGMDGMTCQDVRIPAGHRSDRWGAVVSAEVGSCSSSWWVACPDAAANWPDQVVVNSVRVTAIQ